MKWKTSCSPAGTSRALERPSPAHSPPSPGRPRSTCCALGRGSALGRTEHEESILRSDQILPSERMARAPSASSAAGRTETVACGEEKELIFLACAGGRGNNECGCGPQPSVPGGCRGAGLVPKTGGSGPDRTASIAV